MFYIAGLIKQADPLLRIGVDLYTESGDLLLRTLNNGWTENGFAKH